MKCYECKWLDRSVILTSNPPQYGCTLGFGSHYADHECEYDFMPIVRCKDCRWYQDTFFNTKVNPYCVKEFDEEFGALRGGITEDSFCSWGERKGGDDE